MESIEHLFTDKFQQFASDINYVKNKLDDLEESRRIDEENYRKSKSEIMQEAKRLIDDWESWKSNTMRGIH